MDIQAKHAAYQALKKAKTVMVYPITVGGHMVILYPVKFLQTIIHRRSSVSAKIRGLADDVLNTINQ